MEKRRVDIEDRVFRAWGLLTHCRYVSLREAIEALSALRLGVALGLITTVDAPTITALLFLSPEVAHPAGAPVPGGRGGRQAHRLHPGQDHPRGVDAGEGEADAMFKGLTQRAQKVLTILAQEEAKRFHSDQLLPEHIILALLKDGEGVAVKALQRIKVSIAEMQAEIEKSLPKGKGGLILGDVPPSKRGQKILEDSAEEARNMGHEYIGTEHLLLAAVKEQGSIVARYLARYNITPNGLREAILQISGTGDYKGAPAPAAKKKPAAPTKKPTPTLDEFGRDLTAFARENKLDPVIGREKEIQRVIQILARRTKNNPVLIGEPGRRQDGHRRGPGAEDRGRHRARGPRRQARAHPGPRLPRGGHEVPRRVRGAPEAGDEGDPRRAGNVVLFIDELHTIIGAGGAEGAIDASNMLKPALSRGELQCIGATTLNEYKKHIEKDAALERRFQPIYVSEPSVEETVEILKGIKKNYEEHHRVVYTAGGHRGGVHALAALHHRALPPGQGHRPHRRVRLPQAHPATPSARGSWRTWRRRSSGSTRRRPTS